MNEKNNIGRTFFDFLTEFLKGSKVWVLLVPLFFFAILLWVHINAKPGGKISLFGVIEYQKKLNENNPIETPSSGEARYLGKQGKNTIRICGSNTLGSKLMPKIVESYLHKEGAKSIDKDVKNGNFSAIISSGKKINFNIFSNGTSNGFRRLGDGDCDIVMASREITSDESHSLFYDYGNLGNYGAENLIALGGVVIITSHNNPLDSISISQIRKIFNGKYVYWSDILGHEYNTHQIYNKKIIIYSRPRDNSGTFDLFSKKVLGKSYRLSEKIKYIEDSRELSDEVANTPEAIGFVGFPFVGDSKAMGVYDTDDNGKPLTESYFPNENTISVEKYLLSRRLYLYLPSEKRKESMFSGFVSYAKNQKKIIKELNYVDPKSILKIEKKDSDKSISHLIKESAKSKYSKLDGYNRGYSDLKRRLIEPLRMFFFKSCSDQMDNKALEDLGEVVDHIKDNNYKNIYVFGHADNLGSQKVNSQLSKLRVEAIKGQLEKKGIEVTNFAGLAAGWPIASNSSPEGRFKNRRVEIWVEK